MSDETKVPAIPAVTASNVADVARAVKQLIEVREGLTGNPLDANVTYRDLVDLNIAKIMANFGGSRGSIPVVPPGMLPDGYDPATDFTPPPRPTGFIASGSLSNVILEWDTPVYRNHAYTEIWRGPTNALGDAQKVGTAEGAIYADRVGSAQSNFYWIRFVSLANVSGPYNATDGTVGETAPDVQYLLGLLSGQITETELFSALAGRIDLIDAPTTGLVTKVASVTQRIDALEQGSGNGATVQYVDQAVANESSARATAVQTVQSHLDTTNGNLASVKVTADTSADRATGLEAQYTVKVDIDGASGGYGLAATSAGAGPTVDFGVRANKFYVAPPVNIVQEATPAGSLGQVWYQPSSKIYHIHDGSTWNAITTLPFIVQTTPYTNNGVAVPAGVYIKDAYIANGAIVNAKIGNLAVDDAKIANLSVAKLLAGSIDVSAYIQSSNYVSGSAGFRIAGSGQAEFNNVVVRGTIYATARAIGGSYIDATGIQSLGYSSTTGWRINANGSAVFNDLTFRGTLDGPNGTLGVITACTIRSAASGARTEMTETGFRCYDGVLALPRVEMGLLS